MAQRQQRTSYVCRLTPEQADRLRESLEPRGWKTDTIPHARWRAAKDKTTVVAYESGKLVVQGKGTPEFVQFILEPEILREARFGYENELARVEQPDMFEPHAGIDESGKGDYFGPLVVAAAYVDASTASHLLELGTTDSKRIKSDKRINDLADDIRSALRGRFSIVPIGPEAYNRLHKKVGNVNRLLAWGHARALENLLEKVPDCPRALADQFGNKQTVENALMAEGRRIRLEQKPRAEADIAVAAASILARAEFVRRLTKLAQDLGRKSLPKGAGSPVLEAAADIVDTHGENGLEKVAKMHFKTTGKVLADTSFPRKTGAE